MSSKTILLKSLTLVNFKGIKNLTISFNDQENSISGDNATGKTTIMDAFTYLLFGKDSSGRSDFNIKPLDPVTGEPIHQLEHEVTAVLSVNSEIITLKKVYKEKWVKRRGQAELFFDGHETTNYVNEVPLAQRDYISKIEQICPERVFKLLTNPLFFPGLNWSEQRQMLVSIAGEISDKDIAGLNPAFAELLNQINGSKTIEEYKREIAMKKKRIKDNLDQIPARIDEVQRGLPVAQDWAAIAGSIADLQNSINEIDSQIADVSKGLEGENEKRIELANKISFNESSKKKIDQDLKTHLDDLRFEYDRQIRIKNSSILGLEDTLSQNKTRINSLKSSIETLKKQREEKLAEWHAINDEPMPVFKTDNICPTCKQPLPEDMIEADHTKVKADFNDTRASRKANNVSAGKAIAASVVETEAKLTACETIVRETEAKISEAKKKVIQEPDIEAATKAFLETKKYDVLVTLIEKQKEELRIIGPVNVADTSSLQEKKKAEQLKLDGLKKDLTKRDQITAGEKRIEQLKAEQKMLSQELADFEKIEYTIARFTKAKIEAVEQKINSMFRIVRFKMFNIQINGGEQETCECAVDGVPYSDLNNGMKINAGIDILTTLAEKYGIKGPIFLDNRESVNNILPVQSQLINLVVTKDKQLVFN